MFGAVTATVLVALMIGALVYNAADYVTGLPARRDPWRLWTSGVLLAVLAATAAVRWARYYRELIAFVVREELDRRGK
jgi:hypothetical protein